MTSLDAGVGSTPASRPSVFTPPSPIVDTPTIDRSIATTTSARPDVFSSGATAPAYLNLIFNQIPFSYNTTGILTGAPLYYPNIGDILYDGWFDIDTPWNGTTPTGDIGLISSGYSGILLEAGSTTQTPGTNFLQDMTVVQDTSTVGLEIDVTGTNNTLMAACITGQTFGLGKQYVPSRFISTNPVCVVVSQTGLAGGADPKSTQGFGYLVLVTATAGGKAHW
jgi:hypothetical protein